MRQAPSSSSRNLRLTFTTDELKGHDAAGLTANRVTLHKIAREALNKRDDFDEAWKFARAASRPSVTPAGLRGCGPRGLMAHCVKPKKAFTNMRMRFLVALAPLLLASCGSGSDTPPPVTNAPPVFTSPQTASVVENSIIAYQATASDAENDPVYFVIDGGADGALFYADATSGIIKFRTPPDYEFPADADGDNVYNVRIKLTYGTGGELFQTVNITVTNSKEGVTVKRIGTGFDQPVFVEPVSVHPFYETRDFYVLEKGGRIYRLNPDTGAKTLFFTVEDLSTAGEGGLLSMAVLPRPELTDHFIIYCTNAAGDIEIRLYGMVAGSRQILDKITIPHPGSNNHYGGAMIFGGNETNPGETDLYVGVGDGGGTIDPMTTSQNPFSRLGKILRIKVPLSTSSPMSLETASGNPYINGGGDPYVWALGLRNPFRMGPADYGGIAIGDVGQDAIEELNILEAGIPLQNFGWPYREGTQPYSGTAPAGLIDPVLEYSHGTGPREGRSIIAGSGFLFGYIFGDFISGNIWSVKEPLRVGQTLPSSRFARRNEDFQPDVGTINQPVAFREGVDENRNVFLLIVDFDGEIFKATM